MAHALAKIVKLSRDAFCRYKDAVDEAAYKLYSVNLKGSSLGWC